MMMNNVSNNVKSKSKKKDRSMKNEKVAKIIEITIRKVVKTTIRRNMSRKIDVNILISQSCFHNFT
jgi:hypothetical protein